MKRNIFENIIFIMISIIILLTGILVGSPIKYNCTIITIITLITYILFLIGKFIFKEKCILKSKLEVFIILLGMSTCIPLIFKTYISLNDTVYNIFKYITVIPIYFMIRDLCSSNKKYIGYLLNIIIVSSIVVFVIGIDKMSTNWSLELLRKLEVVDVLDNENRMLSTFGYANSFAVCMAFSLFLSIGKYLKSDKTIYSVFTFLLMSGLILSYSRATLLLVILAFILYILNLKNKELKVKVIVLFLVSIVLAIIHSKIFLDLILIKRYILIWIITILGCIGIYLLFELIKQSCKHKEKIKNFNVFNKINKLNIKIKEHKNTAIVIGILLLIFFIIILFIEEPLILFKNKEKVKEVKYKIPNIKANETYEIEFDIEANAKLDRDIYTILIEEENKYYDKINETSIEFGIFNGNKKIRIQTSRDTIEFALYFKSASDVIQNGLKINEVKINGKHFPINYKFIPNSLITKVKSFNLNSKSIWERTTFYTDSLKIIKNNWLFGIGGGGWKYKQLEVQSYMYYTYEMHSYPLQMFLESGILAFISFIGIIIYLIILIKDVITNKTDIYKISVLISVLILLFHSMIDFDLSFLYNLMILFIGIGVLASNDLNEFKKSKGIFLIIIICICTISLIFNITDFVMVKANKITSLNIYNKLLKEQILKSIKEENIDILFNLIETEKYENLEYIEKTISLLIKFEDDNTQSNIEKLYNSISKNNYSVSVPDSMDRNNKLLRIANILFESNNKNIKKYAIKFVNLALIEYNKNIELLEQTDINRLSTEDINRYRKELEGNMETAKRIKERLYE